MVCTVLWISVHVSDSCNHHHSQDAEQFHHLKNFLLLPSYTPPHRIPGKRWPVAHTYPFLFWRMFCKWDHAICNLLRLTFFGIMPLRFIPVFVCISSSFLLPSNIPFCGWITDCFSIHLLKDIWIVSILRWLWTKPPEIFMDRFQGECEFSFL